MWKKWPNNYFLRRRADIFRELGSPLAPGRSVLHRSSGYPLHMYCEWNAVSRHIWSHDIIQRCSAPFMRSCTVQYTLIMFTKVVWDSEHPHQIFPQIQALTFWVARILSVDHHLRNLRGCEPWKWSPSLYDLEFNVVSARARATGALLYISLRVGRGRYVMFFWTWVTIKSA